MGIDESLRAAIGYMLPEGTNLEQLVVGLFERVQDEARYSDAMLVRWQGEEELDEGWGDLVVTLERVGGWDHWVIARRDERGDLWGIIEWEAVDILDDDEERVRGD